MLTPTPVALFARLALALPLLTTACSDSGADGGSADESRVTATSGTGMAFAVSEDEPVRLISAALEQKACSSCILFSGMIEVKNLAFEKVVDVVYGCPVNEGNPEGAWTWRETPARFQQGLGGDTEIWSFRLQQPGCFRRLQLALRYRVLGTTHWDNNCGWNYEIDVPAGSPAGGVSGRSASCFFRP